RGLPGVFTSVAVSGAVPPRVAGVGGTDPASLWSVSEDPLERAQRCLDAFVVRARRVAAHSLAQDPQALEMLANDTLKIVLPPGAGEDKKLRRSYPPEEVIEWLRAIVKTCGWARWALDDHPPALAGAAAGPDRERHKGPKTVRTSASRSRLSSTVRSWRSS